MLLLDMSNKVSLIYIYIRHAQYGSIYANQKKAIYARQAKNMGQFASIRRNQVLLIHVMHSLADNTPDDL